jgi:hypothetical protein
VESLIHEAADGKDTRVPRRHRPTPSCPHSVSRQLGHWASITLDVYAHELAKAQNGEALREKIAVAFGAAL